jgi:hypothetical protein
VVTGEFSGAASKSCDGYIHEKGPVLMPTSRQKFRIKDMSKTAVRLEIFGVPNTPWQIEVQNLEGKILVKRGVLLDDDGRSTISLPGKRRITRIFLFPTRPSVLYEAIVWGR